MLEWEMPKPIGVARIGKLDPRLLNVAASLAQRIGHGLDHPGSLANGEINGQNPRACLRSWSLLIGLSQSTPAPSPGNAICQR